MPASEYLDCLAVVERETVAQVTEAYLRELQRKDQELRNAQTWQQPASDLHQ